MVCNIGGERVYLWRAVDDEGDVLDLVVQKRRNTGAALKLLKRLLRNQGVDARDIVTDGLASYGSALRVLGLKDRHRPGRLRENNRAENSHLPIRRRERKMLGLQVPALSAALPHNSRRDLQRVRFSATHDQSTDAQALPRAGGFCLGEGGRLSGIPRAAADFRRNELTCQFPAGRPSRTVGRFNCVGSSKRSWFSLASSGCW